MGHRSTVHLLHMESGKFQFVVIRLIVVQVKMALEGEWGGPTTQTLLIDIYYDLIALFDGTYSATLVFLAP